MGGRGEDGARHGAHGCGWVVESLSSASRFCTGSTGFRAGISGGDAVPQSPGLGVGGGACHLDITQMPPCSLYR